MKLEELLENYANGNLKYISLKDDLAMLEEPTKRDAIMRNAIIFNATATLDYGDFYDFAELVHITYDFAESTYKEIQYCENFFEDAEHISKIYEKYRNKLENEQYKENKVSERLSAIKGLLLAIASENDYIFHNPFYAGEFIVYQLNNLIDKGYANDFNTVFNLITKDAIDNNSEVCEYVKDRMHTFRVADMLDCIEENYSKNIVRNFTKDAVDMDLFFEHIKNCYFDDADYDLLTDEEIEEINHIDYVKTMVLNPENHEW